METSTVAPIHPTSCIFAGQTPVSFLTPEEVSLIKQLFFSFKICKTLSLWERDQSLVFLSLWCEHAAVALMPAGPDQHE